MDPHTTQKKGRTCRGCHTDTRTLGLGKGTISLSSDGWRFTPDLGAQPLDAFVDIKGRALTHTSRDGLRPFNKREIHSILYVGLCLECHKDFSDPVMKNWKTYEKRKPCKVVAPLIKGIRAH
jgi:hypothetical protein